MSYVRHEIQIINANQDGAARITLSYTSDDNQVSVSQLDAAVTALADSLAAIPDVSTTAYRYDETGTVL